MSATPSPAKAREGSGDADAASSAKKNGLLFIVSSNVDKVDPETRKRIRSHARREGKPNGARSAKKASSAGPAAVVRRAQDGAMVMEEVVRTCVPALPGRVGSDLSFVEFSGAIDPQTVYNMMQVSKVIINVIYPLFTAISSKMETSQVLKPFVLDATALHINAFAIEVFICRVLRGQEEHAINPSAWMHLRKGLHLLRERLSRDDDDDTKLSDSTVFVIAKLVSAACFDGDAETAKKHMQGLWRIANLKGGIDNNEGKSQLEMIRCDLSVAFLSCSRPLFYRGEPLPVVPETLLPPPESPKETISCKHKTVVYDDVEALLRGRGSGDLATVWHIMRQFCLNANLGAQTQRLIYPAVIHQTMTAAMYRQLNMHCPAGSVEEMIRLGLLAFCYHVFLQWQDIRLPRHRFHSVFEGCLRDLLSSDGGHMQPELRLWLLMTGAVALWSVESTAWLAEALQSAVYACGIKSWRDMQRHLASTMWIIRLDEISGQRIYDFLVPPKPRSAAKRQPHLVMPVSER